MSKGGGRGRGGEIAITAVINNNDNGLNIQILLGIV